MSRKDSTHGGSVDEDPATVLSVSACDNLQRLVRELLARKPGGHLVATTLQTIDLRFPLTLAGEDGDPELQGRDLTRMLNALLDDEIQRVSAFRPGHSWCHRCEAVVCEHSQPPSCRHVFVDYAQTGTPRWVELGQHCLDLKLSEVDRLYDDPPAFVTLVRSERDLHGGLLNAFRQDSYRLLGQVIAGFYSVRSRAEEGRGVLALTIQVAAFRSRLGAVRLGLNVLGLAPSGDDLGSLWDRQNDLPWHRAVLWAQSALETLGSRVTGNAAPGSGSSLTPAVERRVEGILNGLARRLERDRRARARRTPHAEQRHSSGQRPTRKAIDDARDADLETTMIDERSGTVVVLGERGRTHFFTLDGQHVSSVRYSKEAITRKVRIDRWRPIQSDELADFRGKLPA